MLRLAGGRKYVGAQLSARFGQGTCIAREGSLVGFSALCCVGVRLSVAADATSGSEISRRRVAVVGGVHEKVVLAATVLCTSFVRSAT